MNVDNIIVNIHSSIKIVFDKVIYFDPYEIKDNTYDADIIFITHNHYDHLDIESINKVKNNNTIVIAPKSIEEDIKRIEFKDYIYLNPYGEIDIDNINIKTIPAYNIDKPFHPRSNNWLGYIITYNNISYYIAGDTDKTEDNMKVKCDIAFIPIGGKFTMDVNEASELINIINPKVVIPIHYGSVVGSMELGKVLKDLVNVEVIEKF